MSNVVCYFFIHNLQAHNLVFICYQVIAWVCRRLDKVMTLCERDSNALWIIHTHLQLLLRSHGSVRWWKLSQNPINGQNVYRNDDGRTRKLRSQWGKWLRSNVVNCIDDAQLAGINPVLFILFVSWCLDFWLTLLCDKLITSQKDFWILSRVEQFLKTNSGF